MTEMLTVCMQIVLALAAGTQESAGWIGVDVGNTAVAGLATYNATTRTWIVRGGGFDIEGTVDSFHYVQGPFEGDGCVIARVERIGQADPWAKCGVMIRGSTDPGSPFVAVLVTPGNGVRVQARVNAGDNITHDTLVATKEQTALKAPVWIKLERKDNQFLGYYATDKEGTQWTPMVWKPQPVALSGIVHVGLAVSSHASGRLCEAWFSNVTAPPVGGSIVDFELRKNPKDAVRKAYRDLEQLGDWPRNEGTWKKSESIIARSLYTIARARDIAGVPAQEVLPDYYRLTRFLPDAYLTIEALARIVALEGEEGLKYATKCLANRSPEDRDRFYVTAMKVSCGSPAAPGKDAVIRSFAQHTAQTSRFAAIEQVVADLGYDEQGISICKALIQGWTAQSPNAQAALVGVRYMALKAIKGQKDVREQAAARTQELLSWVAGEFKGTRLGLCATAALGDICYTQGSYAGMMDAFQPGILSGDRPESEKIDRIESTLASYLANTLLQGTINPERIYEALGQAADKSGSPAVELHCQRKIAEIRGLSLEAFEQSARQGVKYSGSGPENEVWFWKGLIAAGEGDLGAAVTAYERFLQKDNSSVLAARAYYDIARTKMAIGEDAAAWIAKAKALSPCNTVVQLERRLGASSATQG